MPGVHSSNLSPISLEVRHLQETSHDQLGMECRCFVENFSISPLDSWLAGNACTSCLGMEAADGIPLHLNEYMNLYNDVNPTRAVINRCSWSIRVQIHGWRRGKLVFFVFFNMARGFENVCEIISDWGKWKLRKKLSRSYLQRRKMEKRRPKKLLTTWQCLNYKKTSQQLPSCVFATSVFASVRDRYVYRSFSFLIIVKNK